MEKTQFTSSKLVINTIEKEGSELKQSISENLRLVNQGLSSLINSIDSRNKSMDIYLDLLEEFNYSNQLTSPVELFPGIRTAADMADPEELKKKSDNMKNAAYTVENNTKIVNVQSVSVVSALKRLLGEVSEYILKENNAYNLSLSLISEMDSIYDVGQLGN